MTNIVHISQENNFSKNDTIFDEFQSDIFEGLSKPHKTISSKYFYDDWGSALFNRITTHPDYYLTLCELEILEHHKDSIANIVNNKIFNLIELGPGEGIKTELLITHFLHKNLDFTYMPIDISYQYLNNLSKKLERNNPSVHLNLIHSDYFKGLDWINLETHACNVVLFLGSSIGNFSIAESESFLSNIKQRLHKGDYIIIGFDLRKDITTLMKAYNDAAGITRAFNLNLLHRINRELDANFDLDKFDHYASYNVQIGSMESHLISLDSQVVTLKKLSKSISFDKIEAIHVEYSYKYSLSQIKALAQSCGFTIIDNYSDSQGYFVDSLWQVT